MLLAVLNGKVPSKLLYSEDILTSNVFSFFKYADRTTYLKSLLALQAIYPTDAELINADFRFWPKYADHTEPDLVIIVGNYYILLEAKHRSDFGVKTEFRNDQISREMEGGMDEAASLKKEFIFIAITSDYNRFKLTSKIRWMNWQAVARLLLDILESDSIIRDRAFAEDLYHLLDAMKLRSFLPFQRINTNIAAPPEHIFFSANSAQFRGDFIGFEKALGREAHITAYSKRLFYQHQYFKNIELDVDANAEFSFGGMFYESES